MKSLVQGPITTNLTLPIQRINTLQHLSGLRDVAHRFDVKYDGFGTLLHVEFACMRCHMLQQFHKGHAVV